MLDTSANQPFYPPCQVKYSPCNSSEKWYEENSTATLWHNHLNYNPRKNCWALPETEPEPPLHILSKHSVTKLGSQILFLIKALYSDSSLSCAGWSWPCSVAPEPLPLPVSALGGTGKPGSPCHFLSQPREELESQAWAHALAKGTLDWASWPDPDREAEAGRTQFLLPAAPPQNPL